MARALSIWSAVILMATLSSPAPAATATPAPGGIAPDMVPWVAGESYGDGTQSDPRLDQPVALWGAGIPLKEAFASLREQAGVELTFWPPGDENERICVNLYLDPNRAPSLRELMVQLSWVTECTFGLSEVDGEKQYALLATSMKHGAVARMLREQEQNVGAYRQRVVDDRRRRATKRVEQLREALTLSRKELISRYRGQDDLLLLAMLDPPRRALVEFALSLLEDDLWGVVERGELSREWEEWGPEQREVLRGILEHDKRDGPQLLEQADPELYAHLYIRLPEHIAVEFISPNTGLDSYLAARLTNRDPDEAAEDEVALRRLLGEDTNTLDRRAVRETHRQRIQAAHQKRERARLRTILEERLAAQLPLSPRVTALLSSVSFDISPQEKHPLWQIQELVSATSGMHVISDCFWQPARSSRPLIDLLYPDEAPEMTALFILRMAALATAEPEKLRGWHADNDRAGWEWQDAGAFLRFRHKARDLWRLAFLTQTALEEIESWVPPSADHEPEVQLTLDMREAAAVTGGLSDAQAYHGGKIIYDDPADPVAARGHAVRETVLEVLGLRLKTLRFLASLSDDQWGALESEGLRWGEDLTPDQQEMELHSYFAPFPNVLQEATLRLEAGGGLLYDVGGHPAAAAEETLTLLIVVPEGTDLPYGSAISSSETGNFDHHITLPRTIRVPIDRPGPLPSMTTADANGPR